jgi:uncharacterized membrane protein YesL
MIGFFLKKAFFDGWDNLFSLVFLNLVSIGLLGFGFVIPAALGAPLWLNATVLVLSLVALGVWVSTSVFALVAVSDYGSFHMRDIGPALRKALVPGLQLGAIAAASWLLLSVGLPFYLSQNGIASALAAGILFWCALVLALALQYYLPLRARLGGGFRKNLRKSFILFFDNPMFSIFLFFYSFVGLALSVFLAFLMPGLAGLALGQNVAVKLRLYKYDWIEANPGANRRAPPWEELLAEDRELVGKRSLKGMIFPWKE